MLKHTVPLVAKTPLARGDKPLGRNTGLQHTAWRREPRQRTTLRQAGSTPVAPWLRVLIWQRSDGLCESCGRWLPEKGWQAHHRLRRSHGQLDIPSDLLALHPHCHVIDRRSVHENVNRSKKSGHLLESTQESASEPLTLWDGRRVLLTPDGRYEPYEDVLGGAA